MNQKRLVPTRHMRRNGALWISAPNTSSLHLHSPADATVDTQQRGVYRAVDRQPDRGLVCRTAGKHTVSCDGPRIPNADADANVVGWRFRECRIVSHCSSIRRGRSSTRGRVDVARSYPGCSWPHRLTHRIFDFWTVFPVLLGGTVRFLSWHSPTAPCSLVAVSPFGSWASRAPFSEAWATCATPPDMIVRLTHTSSAVGRLSAGDISALRNSACLVRRYPSLQPAPSWR